MNQINTSLVITGDGSGAEAAARKSKAALDALGLGAKGLDGDFKSAQQSAAVFTGEVQRNAQQVRALKAQLDPAAAATQRFELAEEQLSQALKLGNIDIRERDRLMDLLRANQAQALTGTTALTTGQTGLGGVLDRNKFIVQQFGFQVGDAAVQLQGGARASTVFAQQGSQLLGVFGPLGAVLGAVLAVTLPLGAALFTALRGPSEQADKTSASMERLRQGVDAYSQAADRALIPTAELERKYGKADGAARVFLGTLLEIATIDARQGLDSQIDLITKRFEGLDLEPVKELKVGIGELNEEYGRLFDQLQAEPGDTEASLARIRQLEAEQERIDIQIRAYEGLQEELTELSGVQFITTENSIALASALQDLETADGPRAQAEASSQLLIALERALGAYEQMTPEAQALFREIANTGEEAAKLAGKSEEVSEQFVVIKGLAVDFKDTIGATDLSGVVGQAALLASRLGVSVANAVALNAALNQDAGISTPTAPSLSFGLGDGASDPTVGSEPLGFGKPKEGFRRTVTPLFVDKEAEKAAASAAKKAATAADRAAKQQAKDRKKLVDDVRESVRGLRSVYDDDVAAAKKWREEALEALNPLSAGYEAFAADVELIYKDRLREAYDEDLENRSDWAAGVERSLRDVEEDMLTWADVSQEIVTSWSSGLEDAFVDLAVNGKANIDDLVDHTLEQLARLAYQQAVQPAVSGVFDFLSGAIGGLFGAPTTTSHTGSIVGAGSSKSYPNGLSSTDRVGVLQLGQRVFTPSQIENGAAVVDALALAATRNSEGGTSVTMVEINNYSSAEVKETRRPDGGVTIDIMGQIERDMAGRVSSGRGPLASALKKQGGLRPASGNGVR